MDDNEFLDEIERLSREFKGTKTEDFLLKLHSRFLLLKEDYDYHQDWG